jgi:acyl-CoA synthetase (AMP-forming)/AMP-acid ligase II
LSFFSQLQQHAARDREAIALVTDTQSVTYSELAVLVERVAGRLSEFNIRPGSLVGVSLRDEPEHLIVSLGILALGASQVCLATHDPLPVRHRLAGRLGVTHVIATQREPELVGPMFIKSGKSLLSTEATTPCIPEKSNASLFLKTSGTTGDINIVAFSESEIGEQARRHIDYSNERLLRLTSIEHNNSKRHRLYSIWVGGTNVFRPAGAMDIAEFCRKHSVTCLDISRMHASDLVSSGNVAGLDRIKIRTGGSAIPVDIRTAMLEKVTRHLYVRYAATECGTIAIAGPGEHEVPDCVGQPAEGVKLQIVNKGVPVPAGETGEIRLQAPGMARGYVDSPEESEKRFREGWFYPGDMGVLSQDGSLVVLGRKDDMMNLNGLNIFPTEIESVLERYPGVSVAAALPLPSRVHGQIPVAAVELQPGIELSSTELEKYCRPHLGLRTPRRIVIMDHLPRNSQGKILKREISRMFKPKREP